MRTGRGAATDEEIPDSRRWWMARFRGRVTPKKTGPLRHPERGRPSGPCALRCASSRTYFCVTALLATPPPADFTQTVVGLRVVVPRNAQLPALTGVVAMRAPVHAPPTAGPL